MNAPFIIPASLSPNPNPANRGAGRAIPTTFALGTVYHFPQPGDELPLHTHPPGDHCHISVVLAGSFEYTQGSTVRTVKQDDHEIIDVPSGVLHGFKALEADCVVLNIRKPMAGTAGAPAAHLSIAASLRQRPALPPGITRHLPLKQ
jgi:quercetin dioxygenase-like cupin family protein